MDFNTSTNQLYVADAYFGLSVAGPNGRLTTQLASGVNGVPFIFLDGLGLDPTTGNVYFTQFSARFQLRYFLEVILFSPIKRNRTTKLVSNMNWKILFLQQFLLGKPPGIT